MAGKGEDLRGWLWRARQDQVGDPAEAEQAFGFRPRVFAP
jgi:hypothetical protein